MAGQPNIDEVLRRLELAERRAEAAENDRKRERQRAEAAENDRKRERRRAEAAENDRKRERQRADAAENDRKRERQRADAAENDRKRERQRAEAAENDRKRERQRADAAEKKSNPLGLAAYISAFQTYVSSSLAVETDPRMTTKGSTNPANRYIPTRLEPWTSFLDEQVSIFSALYDRFSPDSGDFESLEVVIAIGKKPTISRIGDEKALDRFLAASILDPLLSIMEILKEVSSIRERFAVGESIKFQTDNSVTPSTPDVSKHIRVQPDHILYRMDAAPCRQIFEQTKKTMMYVAEFHPPHKLPVELLRYGLSVRDIYNQVTRRDIILPPPEDKDAVFKYVSERLTAAAITQTYHYMVESGLEYGLVATGEAFVFLKIDWAHPGTLYYHLAEPGPESEAHPNATDVCSSVGQLLAFTLMAFGAPGEQHVHSQRERSAAQRVLQRWDADFSPAVQKMLQEQRAPPSRGDALWLPPNTYEGVDRSAHQRGVKRQRRRSSESGGVSRKSQCQDKNRGEEGDSAPQPSAAPRRSARLAAKQPLLHEMAVETRRAPGGQFDKELQFCTQNCLTGLVDGGVLDGKCPNVALHLGSSYGLSASAAEAESHRHSINHAQFLELLKQQLAKTIDDGIRSLQVRGSRGALLKITLRGYGYTFVGKGTQREFVGHLENEAAVYGRLKPVQGQHVPVFLGAVDIEALGQQYWYDFGVVLAHLTLLSWGGTAVFWKLQSAGGQNLYRTHKSEEKDADVARLKSQASRLKKMAEESLRAIHEHGVVHRDSRLANMLVCEETDTVMVIDFERSVILKAPRGRAAGGKGAANEAFLDDLGKMKYEFYEYLMERECLDK